MLNTSAKKELENSSFGPQAVRARTEVSGRDTEAPAGGTEVGASEEGGASGMEGRSKNFLKVDRLLSGTSDDCSCLVRAAAGLSLEALRRAC